VFEFAQTELGVDDLAAALMLRKFQEWRLSHRQGVTALTMSHSVRGPARCGAGVGGGCDVSGCG
jgi:hypothetical protein